MRIHRSLGVATLVALMAAHRETKLNAAADDAFDMPDAVECMEWEPTGRSAPARESREPSLG